MLGARRTFETGRALARTRFVRNITSLDAIIVTLGAWHTNRTTDSLEAQGARTATVTASNRSFGHTAVQTFLCAWRARLTRRALETGRALARTRLVRNIPTQHPVIGTLGTCYTGSTSGSLEAERT